MQYLLLLLQTCWNHWPQSVVPQLPSFNGSVPPTCKRKRIPAQGSAACTGSYWTATSPTSLKISIHLTILSNTSLSITVSPLLRVYFHRFSIHVCLDFSVSVWRSERMLSLSGRLKSMLHLSASSNWAAASAQRSFLRAITENQQKRLQVKGSIYLHALP